MESSEVTVILTSCNRFDLLRKTIDSFVLHNTYPIAAFYVYEDSGNGIPIELKKLYPFITWIEPRERKGQIYALDVLWSKVETEYCMNLEDDWEFLKPEFIEKSMDILQTDEKILQVWLMPLEENNVHPIQWGNYTGKFPPAPMEYGVLKAGKLWSGIRFNPALKRKADYDLIAPFGQHTVFNPAKPWKAEADIAKVYTAMGYKACILPDRYIKHIGDSRHVN